MLGFCQNWIFGQKFDFSKSVREAVINAQFNIQKKFLPPKFKFFCSFLKQIVRLIVPFAKLEFNQSLTSSKVLNQKLKLLSLMPYANPKILNNATRLPPFWPKKSSILKAWLGPVDSVIPLTQMTFIAIGLPANALRVYFSTFLGILKFNPWLLISWKLKCLGTWLKLKLLFEMPLVLFWAQSWRMKSKFVLKIANEIIIFFSLNV